MKTVDWVTLKAFATARGLSLQWVDLGDTYWIVGVDGPFTLECTLVKALQTDEVVDFETNFKATGNRQLQPLDGDGQPVMGVKRIKPLYGTHDLKNPSGGSRAMNVLGTLIAPVHFEFKPTGTEVWEVESLRFGVDDVGLTDMALFGGLTALINGIEMTVKVGTTTTVIGTVKDNMDFTLIFPGQAVGQSGVLDTSDGLVGIWTHKDPVELKAVNNDYIRMTVRDNLVGINILRAIVSARKVPA